MPVQSCSPIYLLQASVRELIDFFYCSGDLQRGVFLVDQDAAIRGILEHQLLQQERPEGYCSEVSLSYEHATEECLLQVKGRVDGIWEKDEGILIEEIKTVSGFHVTFPKETHWAQAKIYAYIYARQNHLEKMGVLLTYVDRKTGERASFSEDFSFQVLKDFFDELVDSFLQWNKQEIHRRQRRDQSLVELTFPFLSYRKGQREMAVQVYQTVKHEGTLILEAPTGIGKTMAVLFPSLKAMGEGRVSTIFYLTAKTVGRHVAEKTLLQLQAAGAKIRFLTLTAREKICRSLEGPCNMESCPFAIGYYDRLKEALQHARTRQAYTRSSIESIAKAFHLCPYAFSMDLAKFADVIVCDYNYVFDPNAYLRSFFDVDHGQHVFLIDEAHHLVDRARKMFSATITKQSVLDLKRIIKPHSTKISKCLHALNQILVTYRKQWKQVEKFSKMDSPLIFDAISQDFLSRIEDCVDSLQDKSMLVLPFEERKDVFDLLFSAKNFLRTYQHFGEHYVPYFEGRKRKEHITLFCLDPSKEIQKGLQRASSVVFFSATLSPLSYFKEVLCTHQEVVVKSFPSPFRSDQLDLVINTSIATDFRSRHLTSKALVDALANFLLFCKGNYLVYFPSYAYLEEISELMQCMYPQIEIMQQTPHMNEQERDNFLDSFVAQREKMFVALAVMGGVFGEGIDLVGERLIGVVVVGTGLPKVCVERNFIKNYYQRKKGNGFLFAYTYPGINKVQQAIGRVIRTESDRGRAMLIDRRFRRNVYQQLLLDR